MRFPVLAVTLLVATVPVWANAPSAADSLARDLNSARQHIAANRFAEAATILERAIPRSDALPADMKTQAQTAMHFYAAVAYSGAGREDDAVAHLQEALRITPGMRNIDAGKYDPAFVTLFKRVRSESDGFETFDELYPGYSRFPVPDRSDDTVWGTPALTLLGTRDEKRAWQAITTSDDRGRFIAEFWRARDASPLTAENEFRDLFARRVAFAEATFGSSGQTGALTDRGRVFALLGEPAMVQRRSISNRDAMTVMNYASRGLEVGTIEFWLYTRDQLPESFAKPNMTFRFVTHQGVGQHVLQKDGLVMSALAMASAPPRRE